MKSSIGLCKTFICCAALLGVVGQSQAVPVLQLDIGGGTYDSGTETIIASTDPFTLYALLTPKQNSSATEISALLLDTYYISAALTPEVASPAALGSFTINGATVNVTSDMVYGVPPVEADGTAAFDSGDLAKHGIFETYFKETSFQFTDTQMVPTYNTADNPGGIDLTMSGPTFYVPFVINTAGLSPDYAIHFDLYNTEVNDRTGIDVNDFAPFSHDAQSNGHEGPPVPEPATMLLFGAGLLGFAGSFRKYFRR